MHITKAVVQNYRCLRDCTTLLNNKLNIIVGDNECGKSTLLEAINLSLSAQINGRPIASELHPHLFNQEAVREYLSQLMAGRSAPPPKILIELYFADIPELSHCKGTNNSLRENVPGVRTIIEFNEDFRAEYESYIKDPKRVKSVPVEYYTPRLRSFANNDITPRAIPIKPSLIDASTIRSNTGASRYVLDIMKGSLSVKEQVDLTLSYRLMRDSFLDDAKVKSINAELATKKDSISTKTLSVSLDTSSKTSWEAGVMPHLNEIPMTLIGKGEQSSVKIKLALETSAESHLVMIEEAENHLSHSNLNRLIEHISSRGNNRQIIITTHSSYVLNKLGIENVLLFGRNASATLNMLSPETRDYFAKLPGHDTLRLILARRTILVEGPSDELIVQAAYKKKHGKMPLEAGVDVISTRSLAFKRFLEIASLLNLRTDVITDNDGDVAALKKKYGLYLTLDRIKVRYDEDEDLPTLEPQLLEKNGLEKVNNILNTNFKTEVEMLKYMQGNKTKVALKFLETSEEWAAPSYIEAALNE